MNAPELFTEGNEGNKEAGGTTVPLLPGSGWVSHTCGYCGSKGGAYLVHYDLMRCTCGKMFWALQPHRGGPLVLFEWPGFPDPRLKAETLKR